VGIPWRVAFALQADGWYLRSDIIWHKPNPMPESVTDRPTKAHEYVFLLAKSERYYYDADAVREAVTDERSGVDSVWFRGDPMRSSAPERYGLTRGLANQSCTHPNGKNKRTVWTIASEPYPEAHFATFPTALVEPCVLAGCPEGGLVLDPFAGSGTTCAVAVRHGRNAVGIELNAAYCKLARRRVDSEAPLFVKEAV
jgi:DNA modification methylase